eukprot:UN07644
MAFGFSNGHWNLGSDAGSFMMDQSRKKEEKAAKQSMKYKQTQQKGYVRTCRWHKNESLTWKCSCGLQNICYKCDCRACGKRGKF